MVYQEATSEKGRDIYYNTITRSHCLLRYKLLCVQQEAIVFVFILLSYVLIYVYIILLQGI
jgi:hypothetical protein